jgi:hypothetical protein
MIDRMYEIKYENVNINMRCDGLEVEYDRNDSDINGKHQACFIPYPNFCSSPYTNESTRWIDEIEMLKKRSSIVI